MVETIIILEKSDTRTAYKDTPEQTQMLRDYIAQLTRDKIEFRVDYAWNEKEWNKKD